jgi:N6-adenosine-specific RNA methylase IME4
MMAGDLPQGGYRAIVIDPPWKLIMGTKTRPQHYARLTDTEIAALDLRSLASCNGAWLFVWVTSPMIGRFWTKIWPAWASQGWRFSSRAFVWIKTNFNGSYCRGLGHTTQKNAEDCLLFRVGSPGLRRGIEELIVARRREHSRKPDEFYARVAAFCDGPYIDLFSREDRPGWDSWGDEKSKFNPPRDCLCLASRAAGGEPPAAEKTPEVRMSPEAHNGRQRAALQKRRA